MKPLMRKPVLETLRRFGSFWSQLFDAKNQTIGFARAEAWRRMQLRIDLLEASYCRTYSDIPVFHREIWMPLSILESEITSAPARYGDGYIYGGGLLYGVAPGDTWQTPVGDTTHSIRFIMNDPLAPTAVYVEGLHYAVRDGAINWLIHPFQDPASTDKIQEEGDDSRLKLYGYLIEVDKEYVLEHLGSHVRMELPSSDEYKSAALSLARLYAKFPSIEDFTILLCALAGVPFSLGDETVEVILTTPRVQVITDKSVYDIPDGLDLRLKVGDTLRPGDPLTADVSVVELAYRSPTQEELPSLAVGQSLATTSLHRDLVFLNRNETVTFEDGKLRFPIIGTDEDLATFWAGVDAGGWFPYHEGDLVNPALVVMDCLGPNALVVKVNATALAVPRQALSSFIRRSLSPYLVVLMTITNTEEEAIRMVAPGEDLSILEIYELHEEVRPIAADTSAAFGEPSC